MEYFAIFVAPRKESMSVEEYIVARTNEILGVSDARIFHRLLGGMSNYTYVVEAAGRKYTYRVPGKNASEFVDRKGELRALKEVEPLGLNNETVYFDLATGEKMAEYIEGIILSSTDVVSYSKQSAEALRKIHQSGMKLREYDPFGRIAHYENLCKESGFEHPQRYNDLKDRFKAIHSEMKHVPHVPCHCDYQPSNLVMSGDRLYVLDWEFAGMNDPFYDIACHGDAGFDKALSLLEAYVGHRPTTEELNRLYYLRSFQCLQWYNVATFKERIGLGKDLNQDFSAVAQFFIDMADDLLSRI